MTPVIGSNLGHNGLGINLYGVIMILIDTTFRGVYQGTIRPSTPGMNNP